MPFGPPRSQREPPRPDRAVFFAHYHRLGLEQFLIERLWARRQAARPNGRKGVRRGRPGG